MAEIAAVVGLDGTAAAGEVVVVCASPALLPVAAGMEAFSIVPVAGAKINLNINWWLFQFQLNNL